MDVSHDQEPLAGRVAEASTDHAGRSVGTREAESPELERALATNPSLLARAMLTLNAPVYDEPSLVELLGRAARVAEAIVPGVRCASVTADVGGRTFTAEATHPAAAEMDELQYATDDGPCLRALRRHRLVSLSLADAAATWPELARLGARHGVGSFLASPLSYRRRPPRGSLNIYGESPARFEPEAVDLVVALSDYVARGLDQYAAFRTAAEEVGQLRGAMARRAVIEQAKGILMTRQHIGADEAFELLRAQSQHANTKLAVVAARVVEAHAPQQPPRRATGGAGSVVIDLRDGPAEGGAHDFQSAFDHAPIGMAITEPWGRVLTVNAALCHLLGRPVHELAGRTMFDVTHPDDLVEARAACEQIGRPGRRSVSTQVRLLRGDGVPFDAAISTSKVFGADGEPSHLVMHIQDVSEQRAHTDALRRAAVHDPLTGLPNRLLLLDRLTHATHRHSRDCGPISVLYLDLDNFKQVNDRFGHQAGDRVLTTVAQVLDAHVRPGDTVARVGGDEFVILCDDTDEEGADRLAARLTAALDEPVKLPFGVVRIGASIGFATTRGPSPGDPDELLYQADRAMYANKAAGRRS